MKGSYETSITMVLFLIIVIAIQQNNVYIILFDKQNINNWYMCHKQKQKIDKILQENSKL
jgi:hypothetical protein